MIHSIYTVREVAIILSSRTATRLNTGQTFKASKLHTHHMHQPVLTTMKKSVGLERCRDAGFNGGRSRSMNSILKGEDVEDRGNMSVLPEACSSQIIGQTLCNQSHRYIVFTEVSESPESYLKSLCLIIVIFTDHQVPKNVQNVEFLVFLSSFPTLCFWVVTRWTSMIHSTV